RSTRPRGEATIARPAPPRPSAATERRRPAAAHSRPTPLKAETPTLRPGRKATHRASRPGPRAKADELRPDVDVGIVAVHEEDPGQGEQHEHRRAGHGQTGEV